MRKFWNERNPLAACLRLWILELKPSLVAFVIGCATVALASKTRMAKASNIRVKRLFLPAQGTSTVLTPCWRNGLPIDGSAKIPILQFNKPSRSGTSPSQRKTARQPSTLSNGKRLGILFKATVSCGANNGNDEETADLQPGASVSQRRFNSRVNSPV
jgi:hypothetical protein